MRGKHVNISPGTVQTVDGESGPMVYLPNHLLVPPGDHTLPSDRLGPSQLRVYFHTFVRAPVRRHVLTAIIQISIHSLTLLILTYHPPSTG